MAEIDAIDRMTAMERIAGLAIPAESTDDDSDRVFILGYNQALRHAMHLISITRPLDVQPVRRGGCEYCNGSGRVLYQETHSVKLYLNRFGDARTIEVEANRCPPFADCAMVNVPARSAFIINFCPNCGADMRQEERHE